ncbi:hypothetical protein GOODEAATRI_012021 [Goodea atripinnis]|uniref:Mab-21-like HhH/H2TH-like domain-containing protein n=1 Tax=Goodea atripinnis TaxID=208336 RepID=A0ABV0N9Z1_9TELE
MLPMPVERVKIEPFGTNGAFYSVALKRGKNPLMRFQKDDILPASEILQEFRESVKKFAKGCTGCLKLLKYLLHLLKESNSTFDKFCSYHAKTTFLHACCSKTKDTDWGESDLSQCFNRLLQDFEKHLRCGELFNFFIPSQNLLSGIGKTLCTQLADTIKEQRENGFPIFKERVC